MAEKIFKSTRTGMIESSSHLITSIYGNDSLELVCENDQIHMQGGSSSSVTTRKSPSCNRYSKNHACIVKNATLSAYSLLDFPVQRDSDLYKSCCKLKVGSANLKESKGSHGLTGIQGQKPFIPRTQEPPPDEHSEAVGHDSALSIHEFHGQYYNQTSSSAGVGSKRKAHTNYCDEPLLESSSLYSLGASSNTNISTRKHDHDTDDSIYLSDDYNDEEPEDVGKEKHARKGTRVKRSRNAEIHNLHERKRRDKINKKMCILKELIPNCNKMDKASILDDAIEYLKTLKLQLKIMSMGAGFCMPLMMLHAATHHMINTHLLHELMGAGMGFRPDTGVPCCIPQFPITDNRVLMFGFPNQVPPIPISNAPFIPMVGDPSTQPFKTK